MGTMLRAVCDCGFELDIKQGAGMTAHRDKDMEPAICLNCKGFIVENHMKNYVRCKKCGHRITYYNDPKLFSPDHGGWYRWGDFLLPQKNCLCPKCGKMTMRFENVGCFE